MRLIQLADIGAGEFLDKSNWFVSNATAESLNCTLLHEGDLLISRLGEPLCKACIFPLEGKYITAVDVAILRINSAKVDARYLLYLINSPWFKERIKKYESGTTRKRISRKNLDRVEMQFPTVSEQRRIVSRIEELFSELDNSVSSLQKTKEQLAVYRQAVLKEAFEGRLTHKYRKANGCKEWEIVSIREIVSYKKNALKAGPFGSALKKECYVPFGYKIYGQEQVISGDETFGDYYIDESKYKELISCAVAPNDILISLVGTVGKVLVLSEEALPGIINPRLIKISLDQEKMNPLCHLWKGAQELGHG